MLCSLCSWRSQSMRPNSVHGHHFVLVADGRLRASDKIMVRGRGWGSVQPTTTLHPLPLHHNFVTSPQSSICHQYKMAPVKTVRAHRLRPPATQATHMLLIFLQTDILANRLYHKLSCDVQYLPYCCQEINPTICGILVQNILWTKL